MNDIEKRKQGLLKLLLPFMLLLSVLWLLKAGHDTGQWLYRVLHH